MIRLILFLVCCLTLNSELIAQGLTEPITSKWVVHTQCSDSLDLFQNDVQRGTVDPWSLIVEKVLSGKLDVYKEDNHNFKRISYSLIPENGYVLEYNGDTLRPRPKSDFFFYLIYANSPFKGINGQDSMTNGPGYWSFVYPPPERKAVSWLDIHAIRVRFDSISDGKFAASWIGFQYKNAALAEGVWFKLEELKKAISDKAFTDWLQKLEHCESVGFEYMRINGNCSNNQLDKDCLRTKQRFLSVMNTGANSILFERRLDIERSCLLGAPTRFVGGLASDFYYAKNWCSSWATYGVRYKYETELRDSLKEDYYSFRMFSDIPLSNIDGEDSMAVINGSLQFIYPAPKVISFNIGDWNELHIRETFNEKTQSFEPTGFTYVITRGDLSFELLHVDFTVLTKLIDKPEYYDWFEFIRDKKYKGEVFYQTSF